MIRTRYMSSGKFFQKCAIVKHTNPNAYKYPKKMKVTIFSKVYSNPDYMILRAKKGEYFISTKKN